MAVRLESKDFGYIPHHCQRIFHASKARFRTAICGVRFGKTKMGVFDILKHMLSKPKQWGWIVAPTYKWLWITERELIDMLDHCPGVLKGRDRHNHRYAFTNGSIIECKSTEWPDSLRGAGLNYVLRDEAAYIKVEAAHILRARVSDKQGKITDITSPRGKTWVYRNYLRANDPKRFPDYESFRWPTHMNPYFPRAELALLKEELPVDFYRQEYEAEFLDDVAGVFRGVDRIIQAGPLEVISKPCFIGVDWAKHQDWTVATVMDINGNVCDFMRMQKASWPIMREEVIRKAKTYGAIIIHDKTGVGDVQHDELIEEVGSDRVVGITFTLDSKRQMVQALQSAIEARSISIPKIDQMVDELKWFEYEITKSGAMRYRAPSGHHSDCVWSLALANWGRISEGRKCSAVMIELDPEDIPEIEPEQSVRALAAQFGLQFGGTELGASKFPEIWHNRRRGFLN